MKRRNAETAKMRRPVKRTKITEGSYGNSLGYLKFMMVWTIVVLADYMMDFRFEFLWPFWTMFLTLTDSFKFKGTAYSVTLIVLSLSSDVICYLFIPLQYLFFAASTHVWVQYVWYTFQDKGFCLPTAALVVLVVYVESTLRSERGPGMELCRPLAAHCLGYQIVLMGLGLKSLVELRCRVRRLGHARVFNEMYIQLLRDNLPEGSDEQLEKIEEQLAAQVLFNNGDIGPHDMDPPYDFKVSSKSAKSEKKDFSTAKDDKKKSKNKDKERDGSDSHKCTEHKRDQIYKDFESTKEVVKNHTCIHREEYRREEKEQRDREREAREREKEREKELREREREKREARECIEELDRVRAELSAARAAENDAKRELATALAQLDKHLSNKVSTWRSTEKIALEKKLNEARKARAHAENQLLRAKTSSAPSSSGECDNEWCKSRSRAQQTEAVSLRRDVQKARDKSARLNAELHAATQQVRNLESRGTEEGSTRALMALQERGSQLERALSAETRVKLDLLAALGEAKRALRWQDDLISRQEKEIEELKAQMLAVMPSEYMSTPMSNPVSKLRFPATLNPNATVYTPR